MIAQIVGPRLAKRFLSDPLAFLEAAWPGRELYKKQSEVILSVRDNFETYVHAGNKLGKTRISAWTILWFFCTRSPARVVLTSAKEDQLRDVLWAG